MKSSIYARVCFKFIYRLRCIQSPLPEKTVYAEVASGPDDFSLSSSKGRYQNLTFEKLGIFLKKKQKQHQKNIFLRFLFSIY